MQQEPTNRELLIMMNNVLEKVEIGFEGVHKRQDKTNGNVYKNTKFRWSMTAIVAFGIVIGIGNIISIFLNVK